MMTAESRHVHTLRGAAQRWVGRGIGTGEHGQAGPRGSHPPVSLLLPSFVSVTAAQVTLFLPHGRATLQLREQVGC